LELAPEADGATSVESTTASVLLPGTKLTCVMSDTSANVGEYHDRRTARPPGEVLLKPTELFRAERSEAARFQIHQR